MSCEWIGKTHLEKMRSKKSKKKIRVKLPHVNKKTATEKTNFCSNTVFSLNSKIRAKILLAFLLHFLFRRDPNHYPNLTSKIMEMCEQILKKNSRKNSGIDSKHQNFTNKTVIAAEATTYCIQRLTHYLSRSALKIGET